MHNIENSQNTLSNLLAKVQDNAARSADFLVPTNQAQFKTEEGKSQIILEANEGLPTTQLRVNNVAFNQIANKAGIDVRTASRLRDGYATEFDGEDTFFGLVVGQETELGYFSLSEMQSIRGPGGLGIERDLYWTPKTLAQIKS